MDQNNDKQIPCLIGNGVVTSKKDMMRVLRGFDHVKFTDMIDGKVEIEDEGFVVEVFSSDIDSTIVFNRRLHLNVKNFEYIKIRQYHRGVVELVEGHRTLRLEALSDPLTNKEMLMNEAIENRENYEDMFEEEDILLDDDF